MTEPRNEPDVERSPVAAVLRLFAAQVAAVVGIAAAITVVVVLVGPESTDVRAGLPAASSSAGTSTPVASPSPTPSSTKKPSKRPATKSATAPPPSDSPSATASSKGDGTQADRPKVDVLNQSAGDGAGETTADRLRDAGWRVGRVADFSGTVRTTTVYYLDAELQRDARRLARDLPGQVRVLEGFSTLSATRLSVVLVDPVR